MKNNVVAIQNTTRQERWRAIWTSKGQMSEDVSLHHVNGFLQLDDSQYADMVKTIADPIGIKSESSVLECGCGAGAFLTELERQYGCKKLAGIDYSESLIEVASRSLESAELCVGTICDLSKWADETFDHVVSFSVYFYLSSVEQATQALQEAIRVCKRGGSVYIGDVSALEKKELAIKIRGETHKDQKKISRDCPDHLYLPKALFEEVAQRNGMVNVRIVPHDQTKLIEYYDTAPYRFSVYMNKPLD